MTPCHATMHACQPACMGQVRTHASWQSYAVCLMSQGSGRCLEWMFKAFQNSLLVIHRSQTRYVCCLLPRTQKLPAHLHWGITQPHPKPHLRPWQLAGSLLPRRESPFQRTIRTQRGLRPQQPWLPPFPASQATGQQRLLRGSRWHGRPGSQMRPSVQHGA